MNFCVYKDIGKEIHGYLVPDGYSTKPKVLVRINDDSKITEVNTWIFIEGAHAQGLHETGNVGFILNEKNVPGVSTASKVEISDSETGMIIYRRAQPEYIPKKVLRVETAYFPQTDLDLCLKPFFQFYEHRVEHYGFETVRQMLEILHQPSVYVSGRILLKNYRIYIDYNIDVTMISLRDPFYELALRLIIFSRYNKQKFPFVAPRDILLFKPVMDWFDDLALQDEAAISKAIRSAPNDTLKLLASPFTQQLVADNPSDTATLDDVSQALDILSQFTLFDAGRDDRTYPRHIAELLGIPESSVRTRGQLESVHQLADILKKIGRIEHLLEADLILYHFIQRAEARAQ